MSSFRSVEMLKSGGRGAAAGAGEGEEAGFESFLPAGILGADLAAEGAFAGGFFSSLLGAGLPLADGDFWNGSLRGIRGTDYEVERTTDEAERTTDEAEWTTDEAEKPGNQITGYQN